MSRYDYDEDHPMVVIEKHEMGIAPFLVGLAVGAGVALLFAPRSGAETRSDIKRGADRVRRTAQDAVNGVADSVVDSFETARRRVEEQIDGARQAIDLKKQQVHRAVEAGRAAAEEARLELEQRIAETKAAYSAAPSRRGAERGAGRSTAYAEEGDEV